MAARTTEEFDEEGGDVIGDPSMNTHQSNCVGDRQRGGGIGGPKRSGGRGTENNYGSVGEGRPGGGRGEAMR